MAASRAAIASASSFEPEVAQGQLNVDKNRETWGRTGTHVSLTTSSFDVLGNLQEKLISFTKSCIYMYLAQNSEKLKEEIF